MEERDILIDFIKESNEKLEKISMHIENENALAASFVLGELSCMYHNIVQALDYDEQDDEEQETCCPMDQLINRLTGKCK